MAGFKWLLKWPLEPDLLGQMFWMGIVGGSSLWGPVSFRQHLNLRGAPVHQEALLQKCGMGWGVV